MSFVACAKVPQVSELRKSGQLGGFVARISKSPASGPVSEESPGSGCGPSQTGRPNVGPISPGRTLAHHSHPEV